MASDMAPIADIQQKTGVPLTAYAFIGSSPIRQYAENWSLDHILRVSAEAIDFCAKEGLDVCYVTEDTTRSSPVALDKLFRNAIDHGASRLCLCDTVGHATPDGVRRLIQWTQGLIRGMGADVKIDWHGHNDRGMAEANAIFALEAGAHRVHGCANGIGERVGNAAIEVLLLNLQLLGWAHVDLKRLLEYATLAAEAVGFEIPPNAPLVGKDAFRTATGVHAAAIAKARARGDRWLADRIYSAVPAGELGRVQEVGIGPLSGMSNVRYWLSMRGLPAPEALCQALLTRAKEGKAPLTDAELWRTVDSHLHRKGRARRAG
jgi:2-isopropylmalate synthase